VAAPAGSRRCWHLVAIGENALPVLAKTLGEIMILLQAKKKTH